MEPQGLRISSDRFSLTTTGDDPMQMDSIISELQTLTRRTYGQFCGLSRALEAVGERWGLLIVRDLLVTPRDVAQLHRGLPMIPVELLASRLTELERSGVIRRQPRNGSAGPDIYELTEYGAALEDAVIALGRWGAKLMKKQHPEEIVTVDALIIGLRTTYQAAAARGLHASFEVRAGNAVLHLIVNDGALTANAGPLPDADLVLDPGISLKALLTGELAASDALENGNVRITGDVELFHRFVEIFRLPEMPGPA
ncbi:MAG: winged helix-turn-helix transcriptional regulator [Labedaea sp.]